MCCCGKPTINGEPGSYSWDGKSFYTCPQNPPSLQEDDVLLYDEPGRCGGMDCHSHHFRVVKSYNIHYLLVRHGGGDERFSLPQACCLAVLRAMESSSRYWFLHDLYKIHSEASISSRDNERYIWTRAAIQKRIKVRRRGGRTRVEILPQVLIKLEVETIAL